MVEAKSVLKSQNSNKYLFCCPYLFAGKLEVNVDNILDEVVRLADACPVTASTIMWRSDYLSVWNQAAGTSRPDWWSREHPPWIAATVSCSSRHNTASSGSESLPMLLRRARWVTTQRAAKQWLQNGLLLVCLDLSTVYLLFGNLQPSKNWNHVV